LLLFQELENSEVGKELKMRKMESCRRGENEGRAHYYALIESWNKDFGDWRGFENNLKYGITI